RVAKRFGREDELTLARDARRRLHFDELAGAEAVERGHELVGRDLRRHEIAQRADPEHAPDDRPELERLFLRRTEPVEARLENAADGVGQIEFRLSIFVPFYGDVMLVDRERAAIDEEANELFAEVGVPLRASHQLAFDVAREIRDLPEEIVEEAL